MLTNKGKYGLKALTHLAELGEHEFVLVSDIAEAQNVPKKFLDAILGELRNAGFVHSKKGKGGGYRLARAPRDISIGQVIRVLDGPLAPIACASRTRYQACEDCVSEKRCPVRLMMLDVRNAITAVLDRRSLADMQALADPEAGLLMYHI